MGLSVSISLIGTSSLAAHAQLGKSVRAISTKEGKMGVLEVEGPAAAELNHPKGAGWLVVLDLPLSLTHPLGGDLEPNFTM